MKKPWQHLIEDPKSLDEAYAPYVADYKDFIAGKAPLSQASKALDKWAQTYAHNDATTVRKVVSPILDTYLLKKGLKTDYLKDKYKFWTTDHSADYQIQVASKSTRPGAPGGDKLIEVQLFYWPNGTEMFYVSQYDVDAVLGTGTYRKVKPTIEAALARAFPDKTKFDPTYDFLDVLRKDLKAPAPASGPTKPYRVAGDELQWDGSGSLSNLLLAASNHYNNKGITSRITFEYKHTTKFAVMFKTSGRRYPAWIVSAWPLGASGKAKKLVIASTYRQSSELAYSSAISWLWNHVQGQP